MRHSRRAIRILEYSPDQPRDPAGSSTGGQWTGSGSGRSKKTPVAKRVPLGMKSAISKQSKADIELDDKDVDFYYRVQPFGANLHGIKTTDSNDVIQNGVHVFGSMSELASGVRGWVRQGGKLEIVKIKANKNNIKDNGDYEGYLLVHGKGDVVERHIFDNWDDLISFSKTIK